MGGGLILLAHGSRDPAWGATLQRLADEIAGREPELEVQCAYLEGQGPRFADVLASAALRHRRVSVCPIFWSASGHVHRDLPPLLEAVRRAHPGLDLQLLPVLSELPGMQSFLAGVIGSIAAQPREVTPAVAWQMVQAGRATLVDVRSAEEITFVGRVPGSVHVPWATGIDLKRNADFIPQLEALVGQDRAILFLCRSGKRSARAAEAASAAGFLQVFNVLEGFEGELDERQQRGWTGGWRHRGLPWIQD